MAASAVQVAGAGTRNSLESAVTTPTTFSWFTWFRYDAAGVSSYNTLLCVGATQQMYIYIGGTAQVAEYPTATPGFSITPGTWYWLGMKRTGGVNTYYIGTTPGTTDATANHSPAYTQQTTIEIGSDQYNDQGQLSFCGFKEWNVALTEAEFQAESQQVYPVITTGLIAFNSGKTNLGTAELSMPSWMVHGTVTLVTDGPDIPDGTPGSGGGGGGNTDVVSGFSGRINAGFNGGIA